MSRKIILSLAAATIAATTLISYSADARGFGGGFGGGRSFGGGMAGGRAFGGGHFASARFTGHGGRTLIPILNPGRPGHPGFPGHWVFHHHDHGHWLFRDGRWIVIDETIADVVPEAVPGPCTCLTKNYTPSGLVVFADVCTKESASAPVAGSVGDATQVPTTPVAATAVPMTVVPTTPNYAGRSYDDYLAANPQASNPPAPQAPQKN
jgi:hypothetical protein